MKQERTNTSALCGPETSIDGEGGCEGGLIRGTLDMCARTNFAEGIVRNYKWAYNSGGENFVQSKGAPALMISQRIL